MWHDDDEWHSTDPWYRRGSFHLDRLVLGKQQYIKEDLGPPIRTHVQMLEGPYPVTVQRQRQRWWRTRWPWWPCRIEHVSYEVECPYGIPFPGKGENSWDCGEDGLWSTACAVETVEDACERFRTTVLDYRRRYGGEQCASEPWPQRPADRIREIHARQAEQALVQSQDTMPQQEPAP
jgi:hypothetical protein